MAVHMEGLRRLHQSMRAQRIDRYRFEYNHGRAHFDVLFLADETPFLLLLGLRGGAMAFEFEVTRGYLVRDVYMDPRDYRALVQLLGLEFDPAHRFRPADFLEWIDRAAPAIALQSGRAGPSDVARFRRDVEEQHKIYFLKWQHYPSGTRGPTAENLAKTRKLLGFRYYEICRDRRISSCWTDIARNAQPLCAP